MEKVLELTDVVKDYGSVRAVDGLFLDIYKGDVFGFLGPNGAGKSTTIRMITSLIRPTSGEIKVFGAKLSAARSNILSRIGCIVEKPDFYRYLSARKNLELLGTISGRKITRKKIDEALHLVGLAEREGDKVKNFSHGMKQRLGIAQALLHDPELIILDEPTTGLDPQGIVDIRNLILHLSAERNITVFLSSHLLSEIEIIASRMAIINRGKTIVQGKVADLLNREDVVVTIVCNDSERAAAIISSAFSIKPHIYNNRIELLTGSSLIPAINELLVNNHLQVFEISSRKKLENMYLQMIRN